MICTFEGAGRRLINFFISYFNQEGGVNKSVFFLIPCLSTWFPSTTIRQLSTVKSWGWLVSNLEHTASSLVFEGKKCFCRVHQALFLRIKTSFRPRIVSMNTMEPYTNNPNDKKKVHLISLCWFWEPNWVRHDRVFWELKCTRAWKPKTYHMAWWFQFRMITWLQ